MTTIDLINLSLESMAMIVTLLSAILLKKGGFIEDSDKENTSSVHKTFGWMMLCVSIIYLGYLVNDILMPVYGEHINYVLDITCIALFAMYPLGALALQDVRIKVWHVVLYLTPSLTALLVAVMFYQYPLLCAFTSYFAFIHMLCAIFVQMYKLKAWDRKIVNMYSDLYNKRAGWFMYILVPQLCITTTWALFAIFPEERWLTSIYLVIQIYLYVFTTSRVLQQQELVMTEEEKQETDNNKQLPAEEMHEDETLADRVPAWSVKLDSLMKDGQVYLIPGLTRDQLAEMVGVNRTYLSKYITDHLGLTFNDYINNMRLDHSEKLLLGNEMSISDVAIQSGFHDRQSFNYSFRKRHDTSPTAWRNSRLSQ